MSDAAIDVLEQNLENLRSSIRWLARSYEKCVAVGVKAVYAEEEFDDFENLTSRYARTIDLIVNKILQSIDAVEFPDGGSLIDAANRAEKRGIIASVDRLRDLKDLRTDIAHEYETSDLSGLFEAVLTAVPEVFAIAERIDAYCRRYVKND